MPKIFLNYDQQIEKLKNEKNLRIDDMAYAKEILRQTIYYSLTGGYKDIFKNPTTKKYKDGTRFEDIVELYYFDESLRQLFMRYLIKVENEIKSQVSYYFTEKNGENQKEVVIHMASRSQGITVEIGGGTTKLSKALEGVNKSIKGTQSGLKNVNKLLKLDPSNTELVVQKQKMLKDAIQATFHTIDGIDHLPVLLTDTESADCTF